MSGDNDLVPADIECEGIVWDLAFHPKSDVVAVGGIDGRVQVYGYAKDETNMMFDFKCHKDGVRAMEFSPDGQCLYTVSSDRTLKATECTTKTVVFDKRDTGHNEALNALHFLDEQLFVTGCDDGIIQLWDRRQLNPVMKWDDLLGMGVHCFAHNTAKGHILAGADDGSIAIFGLRKDEAEVLTTTNDDGVMSLCMMNDDKHVAAGCSSGHIRLWKYGVWDKPCDNLKGHPCEVEGILKLKDGDVATASCDGIVRAVRLTPQPKLLDTLGSLEDAACMRLAQSRCGGVVGCAGGESVAFFDVRKYVAGQSEQPAGHGTSFLRQAEDGEDEDMACDDDDDSDSDSDSDEATPEPEKKHKKGKHRVDFKAEGARKHQKDFFKGL